MHNMNIPGRMIHGVDRLALQAVRHPIRAVEVGVFTVCAAIAASKIWDGYIDEQLHDFKENVHERIAARRQSINDTITEVVHKSHMEGTY